MILIKEAAALLNRIKIVKQSSKTVGFVPTMGALHDGHISLIKASEKKSDYTVVSIFINPAQFNDPLDYQKYPVTIAKDILLLERSGCDILFMPFIEEVYPEGLWPGLQYDLGDIENVLEGKYRPGHFQGVCRVVHTLLKMVTPHYIFMGQKDYQQCLIVKRLIELKQLTVKLVIESTCREPNGLAMSSRNLRLNEEQKNKASGIYKMLNHIESNYLTTPLLQLQQYATGYLLQNGFEKVDYVSIADAETLLPVVTYTDDSKLVALIAAFIGEVRLIDNKVLSTSAGNT